MTRPRQVLPGRTYLLTRRCVERRFLMRPDPATNNAFIYCLAVAAERFDIDVLFTVAMSNHHHTGIVDNHGNYPEFLQYFHKLFAKCQNSLRGRWGSFWDAEQASVVRLVEPGDVLDKLAYAVCNPVEANLVEQALSWPGVSSYRASLQGTELKATRPTHFFREEGPMPEAATLTFARPEGFQELSHEKWCELLKKRVSQREKELRRSRARRGVKAAGIRAVIGQHWASRSREREPRRRLNPRVACKNQWLRVAALRENKLFERAYREARNLFKNGFRKVVFPAGTYWLTRSIDAVSEDALHPIAA